MHGVDRERPHPVAGNVAVHWAVVLPAFERLAPGRPPELQQERHRADRAVRDLLSATAAETPVVLALVDVQWADPGSIELLCHPLTHPPRGAVLLAVGLRCAQVPPRLRAAPPQRRGIRVPGGCASGLWTVLQPESSSRRTWASTRSSGSTG